MRVNHPNLAIPAASLRAMLFKGLDVVAFERVAGGGGEAAVVSGVVSAGVEDGGEAVGPVGGDPDAGVPSAFATVNFTFWPNRQW